MDRIRKLAVQENMIVICSIHQPATRTFNIFSHLVLLSGGKTIYCGKTHDIESYFSTLNLPLPLHMNPAEFLLDICNTDFEKGEDDMRESSQQRLERLVVGWNAANTDEEEKILGKYATRSTLVSSPNTVLRQTFILSRRSWIKSHRDLLAYWIRVVMYLGRAIYIFPCITVVRIRSTNL